MSTYSGSMLGMYSLHNIKIKFCDKCPPNTFIVDCPQESKHCTTCDCHHDGYNKYCDLCDICSGFVHCNLCKGHHNREYIWSDKHKNCIHYLALRN